MSHRSWTLARFCSTVYLIVVVVVFNLETAFRWLEDCKSTTTSLPWECLLGFQIVVHANLVCSELPIFCLLYFLIYYYLIIDIFRYIVVGPCELAIDITHISCSTQVSYPHKHWMISQSVVKPVKRIRIDYLIHIMKWLNHNIEYIYIHILSI